MPDKVLFLMTLQQNFIRVRASHIRVLWIQAGANPDYLLYVDGCPNAFEITELSAKEVGDAMDGTKGTEGQP